MDVKATKLTEVLLLRPRYFHDSRGYFVETYNQHSGRQLGLTTCFVQDNQSLSFKRATVRALHFQIPPRAQAKLVRVLRGSIFDVAVDFRLGSPTYGQWVAETLTADGGEQMFVPRGFGHGFYTLEENTEVAYKVDEYYAPECEQGILWNDPILAIDWPGSSAAVVLSEKDRALGCFADFVSQFRYSSS